MSGRAPEPRDHAAPNDPRPGRRAARRRSSCALLLALPCVAAAGPWKGEAGAGLLATGGNSQTESLNAKLLLDYLHPQWKNRFTATAVNSGDDQRRTAERYSAANQFDYDFGQRNYGFATLEWEKDLFGGYRERTSEVIGYGRHVLTGPVHTLDLEIGAGARQTEEQGTGVEDDDVIGRLRGTYIRRLSDTSALAQSLKVDTGASNTSAEAITELKLSVIGRLFATLSFTVRHNTDVPAATEKTDTVTAVNLSLAFGGP